MPFWGLLGENSLGEFVLAGAPEYADQDPFCSAEIPPESRSVVVPVESRSATVPIEVRSFVVPARCEVYFPIDIIVFDANADLPFQMTWTPWLEGATADNVEAVVQGANLIETHDLVFDPAGVATVWARGLGIVGTAYLTLRITASDGRVDDRSWQLTVGHR